MNADPCNLVGHAQTMLAVDRITKRFGSLVANDQVSLCVGHGEIHALLGENGAGKSTLVKMLYGSLQPDAGRIIWGGRPKVLHSPFEARRTGIGMVFQNFSLFDSLSVAENIALSCDAPDDTGDIAHRAGILSETYGLPLHPHAIAGDLSVGERQRVEIVRCLLQEPDLIILDEPTSVLTPWEADQLFVTLKRLKAEGKSVLYISHRLEEVRELCDRATILRHGKVVSGCDPGRETAASLAALMVGRNVQAAARRTAEHMTGEPLLQVRSASLRAAAPFAVALKDIGFSVKSGEILGIAGVAGNGQSELFRLLSGEVSAPQPEMISITGLSAGRLCINQRRKLGAGFVPEERLGHGAVPDLSLSENLLLSRHNSDSSAFLGPAPVHLLRGAALAAAAETVCARMDVRKSGDNPEAASLSGGNLQKFIMGRELERKPKILVVHQPTWGVDAAAAANIRRKLVDLAKDGSAVLVMSQDLDEIMEICDRVAVMHDGLLSDALEVEALTPERLGLLMGGMEDVKPCVLN